jgi:hypothetical protein
MEHLEAAGLATFPKSRSSFLLRILYGDNPKFIFSFVVVSFGFFVLERRATACRDALVAWYHVLFRAGPNDI